MPRNYRCNCCLSVVSPATGTHKHDLHARRPGGFFDSTMSAVVTLAPDRYEGCAHFVLFRLRTQYPGTADDAQDYYTYNTPSIFKGEYEAESYLEGHEVTV